MLVTVGPKGNDDDDDDGDFGVKAVTHSCVCDVCQVTVMTTIVQMVMTNLPAFTGPPTSFNRCSCGITEDAGQFDWLVRSSPLLPLGDFLSCRM